MIYQKAYLALSKGFKDQKLEMDLDCLIEEYFLAKKIIEEYMFSFKWNNSSCLNFGYPKNQKS